MKIVNLKISNILRLSAVEITPEGNLIIIGGENAQGKTSVLESIIMALAGGKLPDKPVHGEAEKGYVIVELDDFTVTVRITKEGKKTIVVTAHENNATMPSPQALLNSFAGALTFDPLSFKGMKPADQLEMVKVLVGLDFTDLDAARDKDYDARADINRETKRLEGQFSSMDHYPAAPKKKVSALELSDEFSQAEERNREYEKVESRLSDLRIFASDFQKNVKDLEIQLANQKAGLENSIKEGKEVKVELESMQTVELESIREKIKLAESTNSQVDANSARKEVLEQIKASKDGSDTLTSSLDYIKNKKKAAMEAANFPVPDLSFGEGMVLYKGFPFSQASDAEKLIVSVSMGMALNPELKLMLLKDGEKLDQSNLKLIDEMATEWGGHILLERVGVGDECQVIIEDGMVKES